ncbi:MAG: hypothetical protein V1494_00620 [Candidatus Diapherotrites archaeon]
MTARRVYLKEEQIRINFALGLTAALFAVAYFGFSFIPKGTLILDVIYSLIICVVIIPGIFFLLYLLLISGIFKKEEALALSDLSVRFAHKSYDFGVDLVKISFFLITCITINTLVSEFFNLTGYMGALSFFCITLTLSMLIRFVIHKKE